MKIAVFTDVFTEKIISGVVVSVMRIVKGLADRGHKIYLMVPRGDDTVNLRHKNVKMIKEPSVPAYFYPGFRFTSFYSPKTAGYLRREKIDAIYFVTEMTLGIQAIITSRILKVPLVGTFHTFIYKDDYLRLLGLDFRIIKNILLWYYRKLYSKCDLVTCPSESALEEITKNRLGGKRNIAISNGIDEKIFDNRKSSIIKKKYNPGGKIILYVGRISEDKNIFYLLDVFKLITEKLDDVKIIMVGGGIQMKEVKEKISGMNLDDKIFLLGQMKHEKLVKSGIFGACDIFMTASVTETQGITVLESQANGLVCMGTDAPGTKDLIQNGYNGFLIKDGNKKEFAEKAVQLLTDENLHNMMRQNTLKEIKKHYVGRIIERWEKEFSRVIGKSKSKKYKE
jgi:1,2-diacylglycerol 3-alpha-glucosyltransferase